MASECKGKKKGEEEEEDRLKFELEFPVLFS